MKAILVRGMFWAPVLVEATHIGEDSYGLLRFTIKVLEEKHVDLMTYTYDSRSLIPYDETTYNHLKVLCDSHTWAVKAWTKLTEPKLKVEGGA